MLSKVQEKQAKSPSSTQQIKQPVLHLMMHG